MNGRRVILASASPRRTSLLAEWGIDHEVVPSHASEDDDESDPARLVRRLARRKSDEVFTRLQEGGGIDPMTVVVLGADTIVVGKDSTSAAEVILGKPTSPDDAHRTLASISGMEVRVLTGVALFGGGFRPRVGHEETRVVMRRLEQSEIAIYVASGEPMGKAGSFAVQGQGRRLIESIDGSYTNVVGLPRRLVTTMLEEVIRPGEAS